MLFKLLLALAALFAVFWALKTKKIFSGIITIGMVLGISIAVFTSPTLFQTGLIIYAFFVALAIVYGLVEKTKTGEERFAICLSSISILAYWIWVSNHWHGNAVLFPILTLLVGFYVVFRKVNLKNEWGFMVLLFADALAIVIENWMKANG